MDSSGGGDIDRKLSGSNITTIAVCFFLMVIAVVFFLKSPEILEAKNKNSISCGKGDSS